MDDDIIKSGIRGCLFGGALGDALGYEIEFSRWRSIQKIYGKDGLREMALHKGKAIISDDTQMTLFTNEAMVLGYKRVCDRGNVESVSEYIYHGYLCWLETQGQKPSGGMESLWKPVSTLLNNPEMHALRAPGITCLNALSSGKMGSVREPINDSKGCGGVMRTAPLGFTEFWGDPLITGAEAAAITHGHPGGWIPAGMLSDIVCRILYGEVKPLDEIIGESLAHVLETWGDLPYTKEFESMILGAAELAAADTPDVNAIHEIGGGWVGDEALAIAIFSCLRHPDNIKEALISAVNHNGDSDSTGAIAGNILGAYLGYEALPQDWLSHLELAETIMEQANIADIYRR